MLDVTFLAHSGFVVDDGKRCYVFDYYKDPNNIVWQCMVAPMKAVLST